MRLSRTRGASRSFEKNIIKFRTVKVTAVQGSAPGALKNLPRPHSVFIGGSGGRLSAILQQVKKSILPQGSVVTERGDHGHVKRGYGCVQSLEVARTAVTAVRLEYLDAGKGSRKFSGRKIRFS